MGKVTIERIAKEFKDRGYELLSDSYTYREKLRYSCSKHPNEELLIRYDSFQAGAGCKFCGNESKRKPKEKIQLEVESKGYTFIDVFYTGRRTIIRYTCPKHEHEIQEMLYENFQKGASCAICTGHKKKTLEEIKAYFESEGYELLSKKYFGPHHKLKYICPQHRGRVQEITWNNFFYGKQRCPICKETKGEREIRNFLEQKSIGFVEQKSFSDLKDKRKLSFDFFVPSFDLSIEYQGEYHDGTIMKTNPKYQTPEDFKGQQRRDELKREYAKDNGYKLLEIWYWDFDNIEKILNQEFYSGAGDI